jgi:CheY-like chemotaxis protein
MNLVGNAIKFTERGSIRVVVSARDVDGAAPMFVVEVADPGVGIAADQVASLFKAFTQVDASAHRRFGGAGLGLAISKRFATLLGGDITLRSEPGVGTSFTLVIPTGHLAGVHMLHDAREASAGALREPGDSKTVSLEGRILLAEDGVDNQRLLSLYLRSAGAEVEIACDGRQAVARARAALEQGHPFDLILMDMQMPGMDGYEAATLLRASGYSLPIVALTAHAMAEDRARCLAAGCDGYLSKPISRSRLQSECARWLTKPLAS